MINAWFIFLQLRHVWNHVSQRADICFYLEVIIANAILVNMQKKIMRTRTLIWMFLTHGLNIAENVWWYQILFFFSIHFRTISVQNFRKTWCGLLLYFLLLLLLQSLLIQWRVICCMISKVKVKFVIKAWGFMMLRII